MLTLRDSAVRVHPLERWKEHSLLPVALQTDRTQMTQLGRRPRWEAKRGIMWERNSPGKASGDVTKKPTSLSLRLEGPYHHHPDPAWAAKPD